MKRWRMLVWIWCMLAVPLVGHASEDGVAVRTTPILSEPFMDARELAVLKEGDSVTILKRQGGWLEVAGKSQTGWVRMLNIRRGGADQKTSAVKEASGVLDLATGRAGTGNVVAATGVRGLDEKELKGAEFDEGQFRKLKAYRVSGEEARAFARAGGLTSQTIPFMQPADGN
jgi:hypothetical protein